MFAAGCAAFIVIGACSEGEQGVEVVKTVTSLPTVLVTATSEPTAAGPIDRRAEVISHMRVASLGQEQVQGDNRAYRLPRT